MQYLNRRVRNMAPISSGSIAAIVLGSAIVLVLSPFLCTAVYIYCRRLNYYRTFPGWKRLRKEWNAEAAKEKRYQALTKALIMEAVRERRIRETDIWFYFSLVRGFLASKVY